MDTILMAVIFIWLYGFGFYLGWQARKDYSRRKNES